jgi:hypothetical protein
LAKPFENVFPSLKLNVSSTIQENRAYRGISSKWTLLYKKQVSHRANGKWIVDPSGKFSAKADLTVIGAKTEDPVALCIEQRSGTTVGGNEQFVAKEHSLIGTFRVPQERPTLSIESADAVFVREVDAIVVVQHMGWTDST